jgi:uncharacterized ParB-like nuclease family protein
MAIDWDQFDQQLDGIVANAANAADGNAQIVTHAASLSRLSAAEISEIIPTASDAKKLAALMKIVQGATTYNNKLNAIVAGGEEMVKVLMRLTEVAGRSLL